MAQDFLAYMFYHWLKHLGIFNPVEWIEWSNFDAVLTIGFGLEYVYKMIEGTCYCKR